MFLRRSSALFIDQENFSLAPDRIDNWLAWIEDGKFDGLGRRRIAVKRVYWNAADEQHRDVYTKRGFEVFYCEKHYGMKNGADIRMAMDIAELTLTRPSISEYILLTSDSDFVPVLQCLKARNKRSVIVVNEATPTIHTTFRQHASGLIPRRLLAEALEYERPKRASWFGLVAHKTSPANAAPKAPGKTSATVKVAADAKLQALERAVELVIGVIGLRPNQGTGQKTVLLALVGVPGFATNGEEAFLGFGSYKALMRELAKRDKRIRVLDASGGGTTVMYVP